MRAKASTFIALVLPIVLTVGYVGLVLQPWSHATRRSVRITPEESAELWNRCNALFREGKYQQVLPNLSKLLDAYPGNHTYIEMAAQVYDRLGDYRREAEYWEKFVNDAPNPVSACPQIGQSYQKQGKQAEAIDAFERCLSRDSANADSIFFLAHALEGVGQTERAAQLYARGLKVAPEYSDLRIGLARVQLRQGKVQQAKQTILPALNQAPINVDALLVAGLLLRREGDLAAAKRYLQRGAQLADEYVDIHLALAEIAEQEKNPQEALRQYGRVLQLQPDNDEIRAKCKVLEARG